MWQLKSEKKTTSGVALVITLILLAVVTVMAVAFLANSRRERGAVTTTTDTANARLAADAALASAESQILANAFATTNPYSFGLLVSTNASFFTNMPVDLTNLYAFPRTPVFVSTNTDNTKPLDFRFYLDLNRNGQFETNGWVTNLDNLGNVILVNGNPSTNLQVGDPEWIGLLEHPDQPYGPNNHFIARYAFFAVPMSGNTLDLNYIYNDTMRPDISMSGGNDGFLRNQGVGSWEINLAAFLADLNTNQWDPPTIENVANNPYAYQEWQTPNNINRGRAFEDALALLKYRYGGANGTYGNLTAAQNLFLNGFAGFRNDGIDGYSDGPLQTTFNTNADFFVGNDDPSLPWAGADNTNHFFDLQDLFDPTKTTNGVPVANFNTGNYLSGSLLSAGNGVSTYDRYTFYRLAGQLGVESTPEQGKMNLNYSNAVALFDANGVLTNIVYSPGAETNLTPWQPLQFFTIAADRMLRMYSADWLARDPSNYVASYNLTNAFSITNIPVLISNKFVYSSAINRVLQLAANIYDATTNNTFVMGRNYPSVFRPTFWVVTENGFKNVYINSYRQVLPFDAADLSLNESFGGLLAQPTNATDLPFGFSDSLNVYGAPWIIGAKKSFPNFNEFSLESIVGMTRRLQVTRTATNQPPPTPVNFANFHTNQMYTMVVTNSLGVECWNSYNDTYSNNVRIVVRDNLIMTMTNDDGMFTTTNLIINNAVTPLFWPGSAPWYADNPNSNSFDIPLFVNIPTPLSADSSAPPTPNWWVYRTPSATGPTIPLSYGGTIPGFVADSYFNPYDTTHSLQSFETNTIGFPFPHFQLMITNRLQVYMLDFTNNVYHVIDYVNFAGPDSSRDLNAEIFTDGNAGVWNTNLATNSSYLNVPNGILNQISISRGSKPVDIAEDGPWHADPSASSLGGTVSQQQAAFDAFFKPGNISSASGVTATNVELSVQTPYSPTRYSVLYTTWQANDPLVHYVASDLNYSFAEKGSTIRSGTNKYDPPNVIPSLTSISIGKLNDHYAPWGGNPNQGNNVNTPDDPNFINQYNLALKDPLVWQSDDWDFPTNKMPTVGWLGRVHRGTPWQTVYLKSANVFDQLTAAGPGITLWTNWTGNRNPVDAISEGPVQDRKLFDLFTTAFNDNATRGQLSVNVGANNNINLAAWSALFSGMVVLSNNAAAAGIGLPALPQHNGSLTNYTWNIINPAGSDGTNSALGQLVIGINNARALFTNNDGLVGSFEHVGDVLSAPQLSDQSPFLHWANGAVSDAAQQQNGISDEMYEWLPQQMMSLLRLGGSPESPMRYAIYCYGQTLKPAPNSIVTSGTFFGMVTNYQVVSEVATRAVVRFNSTHVENTFQATNSFNDLVWTNIPAISNNTAVIESFNVLPPN
ncbi:MAG TPA: hypothetical protein VHG71_09165 [Verrucomicrobiae bacterium]|nr:hypothetical protein [Verrucomicrobiae bacterium]